MNSQSGFIWSYIICVLLTILLNNFDIHEQKLNFRFLCEKKVTTLCSTVATSLLIHTILLIYFSHSFSFSSTDRYRSLITRSPDPDRYGTCIRVEKVYSFTIFAANPYPLCHFFTLLRQPPARARRARVGPF